MTERHIICVTLPDWTEKHYYIGESRSWESLQEMSERMRRTDGGKRAVIRTLKTEDELEFWYRAGRREFNVVPPKQFATAFDLGRQQRDKIDKKRQ